MTLQTLPKYETYKNSGIEWLGEIPSNWQLTPLKRVLLLVSEKILSSKSNLSYIGMENIESWSGKLIPSQTDVEGLANRFQKGDILFGKLRPYLAKVSLATDEGICSTEFLVYRTKTQSSIYVRYLLGSKQFINLVDASTYGSKMPRASADFIGVQHIPLPSIQEQTAIAHFLDQKTAQIDAAIAIKEQQIALLKERKQILIQQAVTQGLDPTVPMKDSGVEWIGEIPAHWEMKKVKHLFRMIMESSEKNNNHELLSVYTDIGVKPRRELEERGNKASTTDGYWFVKKGDIVVNKLLAWMGAIGLSEYDGVTSPAYDILRPKVEMNGYFYHFLFRSDFCSSELKRHSRGIMDMRLRLYFDKFGLVEVPYPSATEQNKIINFLNINLIKVDESIDLIRQQIEKLREYKTTLINSAVTGKIRVTSEMVAMAGSP
ncbi:restriction endonuclease subunit S [Thiothrix lacustris]|uniref:restriction endonuclease subunit S n=1 Tax=Thiothrix lacustris TaxID=525917 RepID=UPI0027E4179E|nr:restriction endonuclease subunit S [Thiothrix lacustris]WMP16742.1 restriction endonuclease subunit S [Thiothrix lacustris]